MAQSILLSSILYVSCILIVLQLTTTTRAQWKSCFYDSCPIKNMEFTFKYRTGCKTGAIDNYIVSTAFNEDAMTFELDSPASGYADQMIGFDWNEYTSNLLFTCSVPITKIHGNQSVQTIVDYQTHPEIDGTAIYLNGEKYFAWSVAIGNSTFPFELIDPPQYYISKRVYQIFYNLNQTVPIAAANYSQLPASVEPFVDGYQYKAVGSEKYLLIAKVTNNLTDFLLKVNGETPRLVQVKLKSKISITIECNFEKRIFNMYTDYYDFKTDEWILDSAEIVGDECRWPLSDSWIVRSEPVKLKETTYELQIIENNRFVYFDEHNFRIVTPNTSASNSLTITKSLLIVMLFSLLFA